MFRQYWITTLLTLFCFMLFFGSVEQRMAKARFLSHTAYYPLLAPLHSLEAMGQAHSQNKELMRERAELMLHVAALENRLSTMSQSFPAYADSLQSFVLAEVVGYAGALDERALVIDRGSHDGLEIDYPVIGGKGVVGKIVSVMPHQSIVLPIDHPRFKMGVLDSTSHVQGILEAEPNGNIYISLFRSNASIAVGDTIVTSNISRVFPKGMPVGTVAKISQAPENAYIRAQITPYSDPANLEHVFVLKFRKPIVDLPAAEEENSAMPEDL